jgi:hypothetical protein
MMLIKCSTLRRCDLDMDCADNSDEKDCDKPKCRGDQFDCKNGECIPGHLQCNGATECQDGSDEENCGKDLFIIQ